MDSSIKRFVIQCNFNGKNFPFIVYIGNPKSGINPVHHQDLWLTKERGFGIPYKVKESLSKLYKFSQENGVSFPDLCAYAVTVVINTQRNNKRNELLAFFHNEEK